MDEDGTLENKMLYELHTIHAWQDVVPCQRSTARSLAAVSLNQAYRWINSNTYQSFSDCSLTPSVSHDGEYIALVRGNSTVEIRTKYSSPFTVQMDESCTVGHLVWSQNSHHLGVCAEDQLLVLSKDGEEVSRINLLGFRVQQILLWDEDEGTTFLLLSEDGTQMCRIGASGKKMITTFADSAAVIFHLSCGVIVTAHMASTGYYIKRWSTTNDLESDALLNTVHHTHNPGRLRMFVEFPPSVFFRVERSEEKFILVLENSATALSILYLPSLSLAKHIPFSKISGLAAGEAVVDAGWWSTDIVALLSSSGKFILVPFKTMQTIEAENFHIPAIFIHSPPKSIFVLEQSGAHLRKEVLSSVAQTLPWYGPGDETSTVNYKLYQLLQTSPSILFYQKIENKEYGEALLLAQRFGLDKDEVYKVQWSLNNCYSSAINDYLSKIKDDAWVLEEIDKFVPNSLQFAEMLIQHGLTLLAHLKAQSMSATGSSSNQSGEEEEQETVTDKEKGLEEEEEEEEGMTEEKEQNVQSSTAGNIDIQSKEKVLLNNKVILAIYSEILLRETPNQLEFEGELFKLLCSLTFVEMGILFAKRGIWTALDILMTKSKTREVVGPFWLLMLSHLPETLDPNIYADILPEFVSAPTIQCTVGEGSILEWYKCVDSVGAWHVLGTHEDMADSEIGLWDEEDLENIDWDLSDLPCTNVSSAPRLTAQSVYQWYITRANQILTESCLFDRASALLELGVERLVPLQLHQAALKLLEEAVCRLDYQSLTFSSVLSVSLAEVLPKILERVPLEDRVGHMVDIFIPFVGQLGEVSVGDLIQNYIVDICSKSLLPALQVLQSQSFNRFIAKEEEISFAEQCFKACKASKNWISVAKDITKLLNDGDMECKMEYSEVLLEYVGVLSPSAIFLSLDDRELCEDMLRQLFKESFTNKTTVACPVVKRMMDKKIIYFDFPYKVMFEECLERGSLPLLQDLSAYRTVLSDETWQALAEHYSEAYLRAATDISHPHILLVRYLLSTDTAPSPRVEDLLTKLDVLELLRKLGALLPPRQLQERSADELFRYALSCNSNNYLQEATLFELSEKLTLGQDFTYTQLAEVAYHNSNFAYCKRICTKAIETDSVGIVAVSVRLLKSPHFTDVLFKEKLFHHVIKHVPVDEIDELLDIYHQLPSYVDVRKRKLTSTELGEEGLTSLKIMKIASESDNLEERIANADSLDELYVWLTGRAIRQTNTHIDTVHRVENIIVKALDKPSPDVKMIANKISDILQGNILKETHGNVNVPRFTYDKTYRREVIMNLAARPSPDLALSLARKYQLDLWEIHFRHYSWLLANEHPLPESTTMVLREKMEEFRARCASDIYPTLSGTKYNVLAAYFAQLDDTVNSSAVNKIRTAIPGLNFKEFLEAAGSPADQLRILTPLLNDGNVHVISKMGDNFALSKSAVFATYCRKFFFHGEGRTVLSYTDRWNKVKDMLQFLSPEDKEGLVTEICLSPDDRIPLYLRALISKDELQTFLSNFGQDMFEKYKSTFFQSYLICFKEPELLDIVLVAMLLDQHASKDVGVLLESRGMSEERLIDTCIQLLLSDRTIPDSLSNQEEVSHIFKAPLRDLFSCLMTSASHSVTSQQYVIDQLKGVCNESNLRDGVLEETISALEDHLSNEDDTEMLVYFKTKPLVELYWPGQPLQPSSILTDELFGDLRDAVSSIEQCSALWDILLLWAQLGLQNNWVVGVLDAMSKLPNVSDLPGAGPLIVSILQSPETKLSQDAILEVSQLFPAPLSYVVVLASQHTDLYYEMILDLTVLDLQNATLLSLILDRDLYVYLVSSELYPTLARALTEGRSLDYVRAAASKLREAGCTLEAVSLLASFTKSNYSTFSAYLSLSNAFS